jgi:hypothetical protein
MEVVALSAERDGVDLDCLPHPRRRPLGCSTNWTPWGVSGMR